MRRATNKTKNKISSISPIKCRKNYLLMFKGKQL